MFGGKMHMVAAVDLLFCLLVVLALSQGSPKPPHIQTYGSFAVTTSWKAGSNNDVDTYVRDPNGDICFFANPSTGLLSLDQDDLGTSVTGTTVLPDGRRVVSRYNGERIVIHGVVPGEYTVDVQMYDQRDPGPTSVVVSLYALRGNDVLLRQQTITLGGNGSETTAFRFTLNAAGHASNFNRLPAHLAQRAITGGGTG